MQEDQTAPGDSINAAAAQRLLALFFFLNFSAVALTAVYLPLHFKAQGLTSAQIGLLGVGSALATILLAPRYGHLYDHSNSRRQILLLTLALTSLLIIVAPFLRIFALLLLVYALNRVGMGAMISASENMAYQVGEMHDADKSAQENSFGKMRLWGSVGFAIFAFLGGFLFDRFGIKANLLGFSVITLVLAWVLLRLPQAVFYAQETPDATNRLSISQVVKLILQDPALLFCILALALTDPVADGVRSFENIFMSDLGQPAWVIGIMANLAAVLEVPSMLRASQLQSRFGTQKVLRFVFVFDLIRRGMVFFFPLASVVFLSSVLNSITYPLRLIGMVSLINARLPRRYTTTAFSFVGVTLVGLGYIGSNLVAGYLYERFGGASNYLLSSVLLAMGLVLILIAGRYDWSAPPIKEKPLSDPEL